MNSFLENNQKQDILIKIQSGKDEIIFKNPNEEQEKELKDRILKMYETGFEKIDDMSKADSYRYIMKNLCDMNGIDEYTNEQLIDKFIHGTRDIKLLHMEMKRMIDEYTEEVLYERYEDAEYLNQLLLIIKAIEKGSNVSKKINQLSKKYKLNIDLEDYKDIKQHPEKITKLLTKMNNKIK